jgi:hypothetical protein
LEVGLRKTCGEKGTPGAKKKPWGTYCNAALVVVGYVPARVVAATAKVTTLELAEEVGLNDAVTPVGRPEVANDTLPVNGLTSVTVMVSVALEPGAIDSVGAEGASVKFP